MFAVDGHEFRPMALDLRHEDTAGGYETFLVCQRQARAVSQCRKGGLQTCSTDYGRHDAIRWLAGGFDQGCLPRSGLYGCASQTAFQFVIKGNITNDRP